MHDRLCSVNGLELVIDKPRNASCPASLDMATWGKRQANFTFKVSQTFKTVDATDEQS